MMIKNVHQYKKKTINIEAQTILETVQWAIISLESDLSSTLVISYNRRKITDVKFEIFCTLPK